MKYFDVINMNTGEKIATTRTLDEAANDIINEAHPNGVDVYGANYQAATLLKPVVPIRNHREIYYIWSNN